MLFKKTSSQKAVKSTKLKGPFSFITRLSGKIYRVIGSSVIGRYMTSYDETCQKYKQSYFVRLSKLRKHKRRLMNGYVAQQETLSEALSEEERKGVAFYNAAGVSRSWRNRFSTWFDSSWSVNLLKSIKDTVLYTPLVSYGVLIFAFALFMLISQSLTLLFSSNGFAIPFLTHINSADTVVIVTYMAAAVVLMTTALMLIFAKEGSLISYLLEGKISGYFLRNFMGVRYHSPEKTRMRHNKRSFVLGVILGLITFFVPPARFFGILGIVVFASAILCIPEFGLISLIFLFPFYSDGKNAIAKVILLMALILVSSILKLMRGKRKLSVEPIDLYVALFLVLVLLGGVVTMGGKESFVTAVVMVVLALVFFVITVLIRSEEWLNRCINAFLLSASLISCFGIVEWILRLLQSVWQDTVFFSDVFEKILNAWQGYDILVEYLVVAILISLGCLLGRKGIASKVGAFMTLALSTTCLILSMSTGSWLVAIPMIALFFLVYSHKALPWVTLGALGIGGTLILLPKAIMNRVTAFVAIPDAVFQYRIDVWNGCSKLLRKCFLTGVGVGESAFSEAYNGFALIGAETAPHAYNLFLQVLIQLGVMGALVFVVILLASARSSFTLFRIRSFNNSVTVTNLSLLTALTALLVYGLTDYIWHDYRIYMLFFVILGLMIVSSRVGLNGTEYLVKEQWKYDANFVFCERDVKRKRVKEN